MLLWCDSDSLTWWEWLELLFYDSHRIVRRHRAQRPKRLAIAERRLDLKELTIRLQCLPAAADEERRAVQQQINRSPHSSPSCKPSPTQTSSDASAAQAAPIAPV